MTDKPAATDEQQAAAKRAERTAAARASRDRIVSHVGQLKAPVTLYRMDGGRGGKAARRWLKDLRKVPAVEWIQSEFGAGRYVIIGSAEQRFEVRLAALGRTEALEPSSLDREAPVPAHALHGAPPTPRGPLFDSQTGLPLGAHRPAVPTAQVAPAALVYDPQSGRYIYPTPHVYNQQGYPPQRNYPAQPAYPPAYPHTFAPVAHAAPGGGSVGALIAEMRADREARDRRPLPPASDMGGQIGDLIKSMDLFDRLRERFVRPDDDEDDAGMMGGILERLLPILMPAAAVVAAPVAAPAAAPVAAAEATREREPAQDVLSADEARNVRAMMAPLQRLAPALTLEFLTEAGREAGISQRQAAYIFQRVFAALNPAAGAPGPVETPAAGAPGPVETPAVVDDDGHYYDDDPEEYSEWSSEDEDEDEGRRPGPQHTPGSSDQDQGQVRETSHGPPLSGPESMPVGPSSEPGR